ncbi:MAG TPA: hypothetical protein PLW16_05440 [Syntrophales bacterium]|nr:hypothetical protein [Syntrophales bacterium]
MAFIEVLIVAAQKDIFPFLDLPFEVNLCLARRIDGLDHHLPFRNTLMKALVGFHNGYQTEQPDHHGQDGEDPDGDDDPPPNGNVLENRIGFFHKSKTSLADVGMYQTA